MCDESPVHRRLRCHKLLVVKIHHTHFIGLKRDDDWFRPFFGAKQEKVVPSTREMMTDSSPLTELNARESGFIDERERGSIDGHRLE